MTQKGVEANDYCQMSQKVHSTFFSGQVSVHLEWVIHNAF